jgi:hypothetical protein
MIGVSPGLEHLRRNRELEVIKGGRRSLQDLKQIVLTAKFFAGRGNRQGPKVASQGKENAWRDEIYCAQAGYHASGPVP